MSTWRLVASWLQTKHCFCDDVALDLVRSAVNAELARVEIFFRRGMAVVRTRHEHVVARRMLAQRKAIIADSAVREVGDALEDFGAPDLEQRSRRSRVYPSRHLRNHAQFGGFERENIKLDARDVLDEFVQ